MRVRTYDSVHRYQPRLIEVRGSLLWFQARYAAWAVFVVLWPLMWLLMQGTGDSGASAILNAALLAVLGTFLVMRFVEGDVTLLGLVTAVAAEAAALARLLPAAHRKYRDRVTTTGHIIVREGSADGA